MKHHAKTLQFHKVSDGGDGILPTVHSTPTALHEFNLYRQTTRRILGYKNPSCNRKFCRISIRKKNAAWWNNFHTDVLPGAPRNNSSAMFVCAYLQRSWQHFLNLFTSRQQPRPVLPSVWWGHWWGFQGQEGRGNSTVSLVFPVRTSWLFLPK